MRPVSKCKHVSSFRAYLIYLWIFCLLCYAENVPDEVSTTGSNNAAGTCSNPENHDSSNQCISQTSLALQMVHSTSPKGSPSYQKMRKILGQHTHFYLDLGGSQGVFDSVTSNLATMMTGYGLEQVHKSPAEADNNVLVLHTLFSKWKDDHTLYLDRPKTSVIVIQTEQICCSLYGQQALLYFTKCHIAQNCIIWEYSDMNYQWLKEQQVSDSTILLPTLHQNRLDPFIIPQKDNQSLKDRPLDVVFFGVMTDRRAKIVAQLNAMATGRWNLVLEEVSNSGSKLQYMAQQYTRAKICLVIHSFQDATPGEYHRLSELATAGCVPVMETFGDTFGMDVYSQCGGVVFSNLATIPFAIQGVLDNLDKYDGNALEKRVQWWEERIQWDQLVSTIFN